MDFTLLAIVTGNSVGMEAVREAQKYVEQALRLAAPERSRRVFREAPDELVLEDERAVSGGTTIWFTLSDVVARVQLVVRRHQGAQILAHRDIDRRAIIERSGAQGEEHLRGYRCSDFRQRERPATRLLQRGPPAALARSASTPLRRHRSGENHGLDDH